MRVRTYARSIGCSAHVSFKLRFCILNTQSIRNKTSHFSDFVIDNDLDLVAISETWLKPGDDLITAELTPSGFSFQHIPRENKAGGGVGLLYKSSMSVSIKTDVKKYKSFESIHAEVTVNSKSVRLGNVYRPEKRSSASHVNFGYFLEEFESMMDDYLLHPSEVIFTGDFNIHVDNISDNQANRFRATLFSGGFTQHVSEPTHRHGHSLDLLITRENVNLISDVYIHPGLSDHYAVMCTLMLQKPELPKVTLTTRRFKAINIESFSRDVSSSLSSTDVVTDDAEHCVQKYEITLNGLLNKHAPARTRTLKLRPESPWFTETIREARKKR